MALKAGQYTKTAEHRRALSEAMKGRKKSPEHIAKIADARRGKSSGKCVLDCVCGRHRKDTPERAAQRREVMIGKNVGKSHESPSEETREKNRQASLKLWRSPEYQLNLTRARYRNSGYHSGVYMRCLNSEGVLARQLDQAGIVWQYEPLRFYLSSCSYLPDFYLPEFDIWIDVKGFMSEYAQKKIDAFRQETGKTLVVIYQSELESMTYQEVK